MGVHNRATPRMDRKIERIMGLLTDKPMSARQLAAEMHAAYGTVKFYLRLLRDEPRRIYVSDYQRSEGRAAEIFAVGDKEDVPFKRRRRTNPRPNYKHLVLKALDTPQSMRMLVLSVGISERHISTYVRTLRNEGQVHISHYVRTRSAPTPHYVAGVGEDAPFPQRRLPSYYKQRFVQKKTAWASSLGI